MSRTPLLAITSVLSLLGIADAWYLAEHALTNTALSCGLGDGALSGCNVVAQSVYSHFFGIPLGVYGVVFYAAVFIVTAVAFSMRTKRLEKTLFGLGILGLLFSIYFIGLQVFVIDAVCVYCIGSFVLSVGIFVTTRMLVRKPVETLPVVM